MAERQYFSLRYTIPGYTFILIIISINLVPLLKIISDTRLESAFGAFLAFLSLLTGSSLGFLISQSHWKRFQKNGGIFSIPGMEAIKKLLERRLFGGKVYTNTEMHSVLDYLLQTRETDKAHTYIQRRWDMYHTLSVTKLSLKQGVGAAIVFRILSEWLLFKWSFSESLPLFDFMLLPEFWVSVFVLVAAVILYDTIRSQRDLMIRAYIPVLKAFVLHTFVDDEEILQKLEKIFPELFKKKEN